MNSIWYSLIWKEWHEHKWKLVSLVAVSWGVASLSMFADKSDRFGLAAGLLMMSLVPLAIFVGLGTAASERSRGTLAFAQSLPVPMWRLALTKLIFGLLTMAIPIVLTVALFYAAKIGFGWLGINTGRSLREMEATSVTGMWYVDIIVYCTLVGASLFIWAAAAGVNRKDEVSAGAVALAVMLGWYALLFVIAYLLDPASVRRYEMGSTIGSLFALGLSTAPAGFVPAVPMTYRYEVPMTLVIVTAVAAHLALARWYVRRFGRIENIGVRSPQTVVRPIDRFDWLGPPRYSAITAIAWKQARESGVLVLAGLAGVLGISTLLFFGDPKLYLSQPEKFAWIFMGVLATLGVALALIVGIGICLYDVGPQLNTFWRSRPINPDTYFWCKFGTGLGVLLVALYVPIVIIIRSSPSIRSEVFSEGENWMLPLLHVAVFAAAVAMTMLVRHAVYAAILSIAVGYSGLLAGIGICKVPLLLSELPLGPRWWEPSASQIVFGMMLSFVTSTLIAWLAMRYDWGRKSRY